MLNTEDGFVFWTQDERPELKRAYEAFESATWGPLGYINFSASYEANYLGLVQEHADHQLCLARGDGYPVAIANTLPLPYVPPDDLPEGGWDWVVLRARAVGASLGPENTMLGALSISVPAPLRKQGIARAMIREVGRFAARKGYRGVVVAARPFAKVRHALVPIDEYVGWKDESGRIYDPWLRSHEAVGGRIFRPCHTSVVVDEPLDFWRLWCHQPFTRSGDYELPGGLVPLRVDLEAGRGRYAEPSVWILHTPPGLSSP